MKFYYPDLPDLSLPSGHRFPASKYRLLFEKVIKASIMSREELQPSPLAGREEIALVHDQTYIDEAFNGTLSGAAQRQIGVPWSPLLLERSRATVGGSIAAARAALETGLSGQLAGGTHHAHKGFGSGFCVFNDLAIATQVLRREGRAKRIAILDLDVHQGDGNAALLSDDPEAYVASVHGRRNFPFLKVPSDLDIALEDGAEDADYLDAVAKAIAAVEVFRPDIVFFISGVDPLREDRLGRLAVTAAGLAQRDRLVAGSCSRTGVPMSIVIGGGYAEPIELSVDAYAQTFSIARSVLHL